MLKLLPTLQVHSVKPRLTGVAVSLLLGLASTAHAAGLPPPIDPIAVPHTRTEALSSTVNATPALQRAPFEANPMQRADDGSMGVTAEVDWLKSIASARPSSSTQGKRAPRTLDPGNAAWTLGLIYLHGAGVSQDLGLAQTWFERAWSLKAKQALAGLAWCAIEGCRTLPNPAEADRWITPLIRIDRARGLYLHWLAHTRLEPLRTVVPQLERPSDEPDLPERSLLLGAARGGDIHALIELGMDAVAAGESSKAVRYFEAAAPRSVVAAVNAAIVKESVQLAKQPYRSDANKLALELYTEAQRFHRGEGKAVNYIEAIRLYRMAGDKGSVEAQRMLALIYSRPLIKGSFDVTWISQLSELDLTQPTPGLRAKSMPRQLQRERTALVDMLPAKWRDRIF